MKLSYVALAMASILTARFEGVANAFCARAPLYDSSGQVLRQVPVYLYATTTQLTWAGMPTAEAEVNLQAAINAWWEQGNANVHPYYAGRTTSTSTTGRILVRDTTSCSQCAATSSGYNPAACAAWVPSSGNALGAVVWIETSSCNNDGAWSTTPTVANNHGIRTTLVHELGHALGLYHPNELGQSCPGGGSPDTSIEATTMAVNTAPRVLFDDRNGLVELYGERCRQLSVYESSDTSMLSWAFDRQISTCTQARPQHAGPSLVNKVLLGFKSGLSVTRAVVATTFTTSTPFLFASSNFPVAHAMGATESQQLLAWTQAGDEDYSFLGGEGCAHVWVAYSSDSGATWTVTLDGSGASNPICADGGPTAVYDPVSNRYVVMAQVKSQVQWATLFSNGTQHYHGYYTMASVHSPALVCHSALSPSCMAIYDSDVAWGCPSFRSFSINSATGDLTVDPALTPSVCYRQEETPTVIYREGSGTIKWGLVLKQGDALYSFRKTLTGTTLTDQRTVAFDSTNGVTSAAMAWVRGTFVGIDRVSVYTGRAP